MNTVLSHKFIPSLAQHFLPILLVIFSPFIAVSVSSAFTECEYYQHDCASAPTTYPSGIIEGPVAQVSVLPWDAYAHTRGSYAGVAIDDSQSSDSTFSVAWISDIYYNGCLPFSYGGEVSYDKILLARFNADGTCLVGPHAISGAVQFGNPEIQGNTYHRFPSVALTGHEIRVAWTGVGGGSALDTDLGGGIGGLLLADFDETDNPGDWPLVPSWVWDDTPEDYTPSAGISDNAGIVRSVAWNRFGSAETIKSMFVDQTPGSGATTILDSSDCAGVGVCSDRLYSLWQPCIASYQGYSVVVWAHAESSQNNDAFDIRMDFIDPSGNRIIGGDGMLVNETTVEQNPSVQIAASADFFGNDIVVTWQGAPLPSPCNQDGFKIFARRYYWPGGSNAPTPVAGEFIVNSAANPVIPSYGSLNSTLAISREGNGRWIAAWTVDPQSSGHGEEVHAQYFEGGRPMGTEFRVNQENNPQGYDQAPNIEGYQGNIVQRRLAHSNQHTIAYGREGEVVCVWTAVDFTISAPPPVPDLYYNNNMVYFTRLPVGFADSLDSQCCKGDMIPDGSVDLLDVPLFVTALLDGTGSPACRNYVELYATICPADCNNDGVANGLDVQPFVDRILAGATCASAQRDLPDCNANEVPDANDIANGTSQDCNANFIPDECNIDTNDPDGDGLVSADVDANGVPDECEPDCNANSVPDAWDISQSTSLDVNANGIPDECEPDCNANGRPDDADIACGGGNTCNGIAGSYDCNLNGTPDECEADCNENGVPDDCDIDPSDPDGDTFVSEDCNVNGNPDECDLELPAPFGSFDCNENGIPDECDIADETSLDENENGIPDECEEGDSMGENSMMGSTGETPVPQESGEGQQSDGQQDEGQDAAWQVFYEWSFAQCWGPNCEATPSEQFQAYVAKLTELGLPIMGVQGSP